MTVPYGVNTSSPSIETQHNENPPHEHGTFATNSAIGFELQPASGTQCIWKNMTIGI